MNTNLSKKTNSSPANKLQQTKMKILFGFDLDDLRTWDNFVKLMNRPEDPSSLGLFRILFGLLMIIDIPNERGWADADIEFGSKSICYFPLIHWMKPLSVEWMVILYAIMFLGAFGIMIGFKYRYSCLSFVLIYWYIFLLDKTTWNNHSYLYGLLGIQLLLFDANRFMSIDGLLNKSIRNAHVPLWNYCLLRSQIFLVYFLAGIKKIDFDWISGYSMTGLSSHWVFDPFKPFLTNDQITLFVVHLGGLIIDLSAGYLLFFDKTRFFGMLMTSSFHIMNSRMFNIGMFPYAMLATTTIFYSNDWPKRVWCFLRRKKFTPFDINKTAVLSPHCIYEKIAKNECQFDSPIQKTIHEKKGRNSSFYNKFFSFYSIVYLLTQCFLPYSHFITKGYNNWTNGLYGYSWDMMIHSWHTQHIKISFIDKDTNTTHYLNPKAFTTRKRWSSHADMTYQYVHCIKDKLENQFNYTNVELYLDVWRSMNHRFNQRQIDPRVNLFKAKWSPFEKTEWTIPLLTELSSWREKMKEIENRLHQNEKHYDLTFVADLNGLKLENYISSYLNSTIEVINGRVNVELEQIIEEKGETIKSPTIIRKNYTLNVGEKMQLPSAAYHYVYTISEEPSCFFYIYFNQTALILSDLYDRFNTNMMKKYNETFIDLSNQEGLDKYDEGETLAWKAYNLTLIESSKNFLHMITYNESSLGQNLQQEISKTIEIFDTFKFNKTLIYNTFVMQFYENFSQTLDKTQKSLLNKSYKKLVTNLLRFKHSFKMAYLASKSILQGQNFMKIISVELN